MERSLFSFICKHSLGQQLVLLGIALVSLPFLYISLELPKTIINDAIGADGPITALGHTFSQVQYLAILSVGFLLAVLASGLIKMYLNIRKGIAAERLLRRFRYQLISRMQRFPLRHFRHTSQGELVSMVTAEAEPLGGIMGDALAQPVFQAGQMLTILAFLFAQSIWLGIAAIGLIPLQAWLIPRLQRQVNELNKARVKEVRQLAETLSDNVAGIEDLRANGGVPYALADYSERLGRLFDIRYSIYRKKFFMKFLNNFINQLTPFFFLSIGGYLTIQGNLTVGALVAALAAYKDLSAPWRELLNYYNQMQDMSLRYGTVVEQFAPVGMIKAEVFEGRIDDIPRIVGDIGLTKVTVRESDGRVVLDDLTTVIPAGSTVAIKCSSAVERRTLTQLLSRGVSPSSGLVTFGDKSIADFHQSILTARIGVVGASPYLFKKTIGENVRLPLLIEPKRQDGLPLHVARALNEARRSGNSDVSVSSDWFCPRIARVGNAEDYIRWWFQIVEAISLDGLLFDTGLMMRCSSEKHTLLTERIVEMRPTIRTAIKSVGLESAFHRLCPGQFNPGLAVGGNLLFALASRPLQLSDIARSERLTSILDEIGLKDDLEVLAGSLFSVILTTFENESADHPLIQRMGISAETFEELRGIHRLFEQNGFTNLDGHQSATVLALPFVVTAEQIGPAFSDELKQRILDLRRERINEIRSRAPDTFVPLDEKTYSEGLSVIENAIFGKLRPDSGQDGERLRKLVGDILIDAGLKSEVARLIWDVQAGIGGASLPPTAHERVGFVRAIIKRPDIVIMDRPMPSLDRVSRSRLRVRLRKLLPQATLIFIDEEFSEPEAYDIALKVQDGRLTTNPAAENVEKDDSVRADMDAKIKVLEATSIFEGISRTRLRLLGFASHWFEASAGEAIFRTGDITTGAYVLMEGTAQLYMANAVEGAPPSTEVPPGRLIGDLSVILDQRRPIDMIAKTDVRGLRIGADELRDLIRTDPGLASILLETTARNLLMVIDKLYDERNKTEPDRIDQWRSSRPII